MCPISGIVVGRHRSRHSHRPIHTKCPGVLPLSIKDKTQTGPFQVSQPIRPGQINTVPCRPGWLRGRLEWY
ncbi:hypothetical protein RRG08_045739 [Elysia crispata]|uniref:Uncharacterized protein n=1 Tax=Elysia crispata TaxID=231223 RepID=A0AAE0ZA87_9GAST|nr:hypothetical protein RRG08_045739 [Elysia crispata]